VQSLITIIDYQMGNLRSVQKAVELAGCRVSITSDPRQVRLADKVILPGVGAFSDAIREIKERGLDEPILDAIRDGKPFLGICLGLQLLFDVSFEGGQHAGLGVIPGQVQRFSGSTFDGQDGLKVPHMGWNQVLPRRLDCPLFAGLSPMEYFYFVHSYYVQPQSSDVAWLDADYGGQFCAAIWKDNLFATQFHPEKSQEAGLRLLRNFAQL
jgi:glutamine amidotransferase